MSSPSWLVASRQFAVISLFMMLFASVFAVLFFKDRQQEWRLRQEQANHRLQLAFELINRDLERVRSDVLQVSHQSVVVGYDGRATASRAEVQSEFANFLKYKPNYQQIRLVDRTGQELVRADRVGDEIQIVTDEELQNKGDRYYVRDSLGLTRDQVFVSEFDLNQEHGSIEQPLNPVIRFVAAVADGTGPLENLLVINYRGSPLLQELRSGSLPGKTLLLRGDGQYILAPSNADSWGWLLGHDRTFANQFPVAWQGRGGDEGASLLTHDGAFALRHVPLRGSTDRRDEHGPDPDPGRLWIVSWLPADEVFANSNRLLQRLLLWTACLIPLLLLLTRFWALASVRRSQQNERIQESERKLRELSTRLIGIQEEERRSISREIHDQLGQQVTALNLDLKLAQRQYGTPPGHEQLQRAIGESEQLLGALHEFALRVRPDVLDDLGLHDAIESHLWEFENRTSIKVHFDSGIQDLVVPPLIAENVFRLVQESMNNVLKHSRATRVDVAVKFLETGRQCVLGVNISDDGVGSSQALEDSESVGGVRLGIVGMKERVGLLEGTIDFRSSPGRGTMVQIQIPLTGRVGVYEGQSS